MLQDPSRVFNLDESGFSLCPKGDKVLGIKGQKNVYELADRDKENVTVLLNVSASGVLAPPMAVFAGKRFPKGLNEENRKFEVTNWSFAFSENGWITGQVFYEYMANTFYKWLLENNIAFPVIVFLDGHSSHLTYHLSQFCSQVGTEIVALFPNATHLIQPLDVAVFGPLKKKWAMEVDRWRVQNNVFSITKVQLPGILSKVLKNELKTESIINGFRVCGLYPFNKDSVDFSKCRTASFSVQPPAQKPCKLTLCGHSYLEKVIGEEKLNSFKTGNVSGDEAIYDLWMKSKLLLEETSIEHDNAAKDTVSECSRTIPVMEEMHVASEIAHVNVAPGEPSSKIPSKMEMAISPETGGLNVPTPFKKYLYWPGTPKKKNTVRRTLNLPTVVTCGQWQDYEDNKRKEKKAVEQLKEERKRLREQKKEERQKKAADKSRPKQKASWHSSGSSASEGEGDNWGCPLSSSDEEVGQASEEEIVNIATDDFVIVRYSSDYFPVQILSVAPDGVRVSTMEKSLKNWKWPEKADIICYEWKNIVRKIKPPVKLNSRGAYSVPEIAKFNVFVNF